MPHMCPGFGVERNMTFAARNRFASRHTGQARVRDNSEGGMKAKAPCL